MGGNRPQPIWNRVRSARAGAGPALPFLGKAFDDGDVVDLPVVAHVAHAHEDADVAFARRVERLAGHAKPGTGRGARTEDLLDPDLRLALAAGHAPVRDPLADLGL